MPRISRWRSIRRWQANLAAHAWLWKDHTAAGEAAAITAMARRARAGPARADRRHVFLRVVLVEDLALPERRARRVRRRGELGGAGRFRPVGARRRRPARATSCAASARPDTRRCTPRRGAACRRRRSSRGSIRSWPTLRDRLYDARLRRGSPAGKLSAAWADDASACAPASRSRWATSTRTTARSARASRTGTFVKIIGTSTCDCAVRRCEQDAAGYSGDLRHRAGIDPAGVLRHRGGTVGGRRSAELVGRRVCDGQRRRCTSR